VQWIFRYGGIGMRNGILLIALISVMLLIGTASAKPVIKSVDLDPSTSNNADTKVTTTDDNGKSIKDVKANNNLLESPDGETWSKNIELPDDEVTFIAENENHETETAKAKRGGCTGSYDTHTKEYSFAHVEPSPISGKDVTFYLKTSVGPADSAIIGFCVYPNNPKTSLSKGPDAGSWGWVPKFTSRNIFGFGRLRGYNNIPLNAVRNLNMGTGHYELETNSDRILMHIYDPIECSRDDDREDDSISGKTCWRRPGTTTIIPEFPIIAAPIAAVLGLVFFFQLRKNKKE
jgi:hypothetical protein